jgi:hypothetical protein
MVPVPMAAHHLKKSTGAGWRGSLSLAYQLVFSVPNLATSAISCETAA